MRTRKLNGLVFGFTALFVILSTARDVTPQHSDDYVHNRIVQIKGRVTIVNHPTLGKTNGTGVYLVFRRDGCRDCLIATRSDNDGNYEIFVGRGRYKVIVRNVSKGGKLIDYLPRDQPRYIAATNVAGGETFDIRIVLPDWP